MRYAPLAFISEDTVQKLGVIYRHRDRSSSIARTADLTTDAVSEHWSDIERHKWFLSERLGRDTGMEVAAVDYFENVKPIHAGRRKSWAAKLWRGLLENLDGDGPRSIVNLERALSHPTRLHL